MEVKNERFAASFSKTDSPAYASASASASHHKRSKSATDRSLDLTKRGSSQYISKDFTQSQDSPNSSSISKTRGIQGSCNQDSRENPMYTKSNNRSSLEDDIKQLQIHLHQERSTRFLLEKPIGRASSIVSPGHGHFSSQTRELIAEIELLEEEIANREQHVLSLYRSMFDQCVSQPTSAHSSSVVSPMHSKGGDRKHPSIISSSFCSSKKFRLQSLQVLASTKETGSSLSLKPKEKLSSSERSRLTPILKDHLHQCPCRVSEEMVRCMASLYYQISDSSEKLDKSRSPFFSRSSTTVTTPSRTTAEEQEWSGSTVKVTSIKLDKQFPCVSDISNYRLLVEQLERIDVNAMENNAKLAFWINIYNSLLMHAYLVYGIPNSSLGRLALFNKAAYNIGGELITPNCIEFSILCSQTPRVGRWFETIFSTAMRKKSGEDKQLTGSNFVLPKCQPVVFFALCTGAFSDPVMRVYTGKNVIEQLEKARNEFLQSHVLVKKSTRIVLPKVLQRYAKETATSFDDLLTVVSGKVDKKLQEAINNCINLNNKRKASQVIEWSPYDTRFCYVLARELVEHPLWV